jgi:hypothetical protein
MIWVFDPGYRDPKGTGSRMIRIRNTSKTYGSGSGSMLTGVQVDMILKLEHANWLLADEALGLLLLGRDSHQLGHRVQLHKDAVLAPAPRVGKNPVFLKNPAQCFFFYIFARKREFLAVLRIRIRIHRIHVFFGPPESGSGSTSKRHGSGSGSCSGSGSGSFNHYAKIVRKTFKK